ncbi:hypothetical protein [Frigoribacterium salinisoli]
MTTTPTGDRTAQTPALTEASAPIAGVPAPPASGEPRTVAQPAGHDDAAQDGDGDRRRNPSSEAAHYRRQLREAEAERDALTGQLALSRRQVVETLLANAQDLRATGEGDEVRTLHNPEDLWGVLGVDVADLFDDEGNLDRAALAEQLTQATTTREYLTRPPLPAGPPRSLMAELHAQGQRNPDVSAATTPWAQALSNDA